MEVLMHKKKKKKININYSKAKKKFFLSLHYNNDNIYLFVNGREIYKFKTSNKNNFPLQFCLGSISNKFDYFDANEMFFKRKCL